MKTFKELVKEKGRKLYCDESVLETIPKKQEGEVEFFKLGKYVLDDNLEKEYFIRNMIPASPYNILEVSQEKLDEMKYVCTHWKNPGDDMWCFAAFDQWRGGERGVFVYRDAIADDWGGCWWFAGLRKLPSDLSSKSVSLDTLTLRIEKLEEIVKKLTTIINL